MHDVLRSPSSLPSIRTSASEWRMHSSGSTGARYTERTRLPALCGSCAWGADLSRALSADGHACAPNTLGASRPRPFAYLAISHRSRNPRSPRWKPCDAVSMDWSFVGRMTPGRSETRLGISDSW